MAPLSEADQLYAELKAAGFNGSLADMQYAYLQAKVGPLPGKSTADLMSLYVGEKLGSGLESPISPLVTYVVYDDFVGADSATSLNGRVTPTGSKTWTLFSLGTFGISSNKAHRSGAGDGSIYVDSGLANCTVECDFSATTNGNGLLLRWASATDYMRLINDSVQGWKLHKIVGGGLTETNIAGAMVLGNTYHIKAVMSGASIVFSVDGVTVFTANVPDGSVVSNTRHGLYSNNGTGHLWDNFSISP